MVPGASPSVSLPSDGRVPGCTKCVSRSASAPTSWRPNAAPGCSTRPRPTVWRRPALVLARQATVRDQAARHRMVQRRHVARDPHRDEHRPRWRRRVRPSRATFGHCILAVGLLGVRQFLRVTGERQLQRSSARFCNRWERPATCTVSDVPARPHATSATAWSQEFTSAPACSRSQAARATAMVAAARPRRLPRCGPDWLRPTDGITGPGAPPLARPPCGREGV